MILLMAAVLARAVETLPPPADHPVDFAKDVKPLLERSCYKCHGAEKQKGKLRLDLKAPALKGGSSGAAIVPGKGAESPLIVAVSGIDEDLVMPEKGDRLTVEEVGVLRRWIDDGASWPDDGSATNDPLKTHWSFIPIARPEPPKVDDAGANPIDAFIAAKLREKALKPSPPADRRTLIRRVYFDVIGLPPSPEEVESFVADPDPQAYEKLIDRLLASPRYGERWGRHWLDVVRFAESNGFETNQPRPNAWPYRDYVIHAFNDDLPYDQFIREQLAGDAFGADAATGFLVGGAYDEVKSPDPVLTANQRADELHDMVGTTSATFLALTVNCARCHNHKFDPIPQTDYYALKAVFAGVRHGERDMRPPDFAERQQAAESARAELEPILARLGQLAPLARTARSVVIDDQTTEGFVELEKARGTADHAAGTGRGEADQAGDQNTQQNIGKSYRWWEDVAGKTVAAYAPKVAGRFRVWLSWGCGWHTQASDMTYLLDADGDPASTGDQSEIAHIDQRMFADGTGEPLPDKSLWSSFREAGIHDFTPTTRLLVRAGPDAAPVTADTVIFEEATEEIPVVSTPHLRAQVTRGENVERFAPVEARFIRFNIRATTGAEPCLDELEVFATDGHNVARDATPTSSGDYAGNPFHQLAHINDGQYGNEHSWISNESGKGWVQLELPKVLTIERVVWSRDRDPQPRYDDRVATDYDVAISTDGQTWRIVAGSADRLPKNYPHKVDPIRTRTGLSPNELVEAASLEQRRAELEKKLREAFASPKAYAGVLGNPEETFRFNRGDPMQPREKMAPGSLSRFPNAWTLPVEAKDQDRRLTLAKWITSPENPLTARVMVNRLWHYHFGAGLVDTPSDFGLNGARPTHPELLDWLASEFVARAWSVKAMQRLILTSATYQQASDATDAGLAVDAGDRFLWRFPPRRLEAEPLRDSILAVSGQLDLSMGGPGFDLFDPNTNYVKVYQTKTKFEPGDFRRMVYQAKPRAELDTFFGAFDCPDAGQSQPKRTSSTTPLQALNLMNSAFLLGQAQFLADRLKHEAGRDPTAQVTRAFGLLFGRGPTTEEASAATNLISQQGLPVFCRALYNTNEFITIF